MSADRYSAHEYFEGEEVGSVSICWKGLELPTESLYWFNENARTDYTKSLTFKEE